MTHPSLSVRGAFTTALAFLFAVAAYAADVAKKTYQLPAGDAVVTLKNFSDQSGEQIVYPVDSVRGVQTKAVSGELTAREALGRMLAGTPLVIVQDERTKALAVQYSAPASASAAGSTATTGSGSIEGRVFNQVVGNYVGNARVILEPLRIETATDESGQYRFSRLPAGDVTVRVIYTGLPPTAQTAKINSGEATQLDFTLKPLGDVTAEQTVKLDAFSVAAQKDMAASDIAVNEQRYSSSIKNVVSADSFGDIAEGNVGEFAKFLPGVTLNRNGSDGFSISIGGVPSGGAPIMVDGNPLSSAASSGGSRTVELEQVSITTMSRVEVNRSPSPDAPANAIGGTVNLVTRSAFERRRPEVTVKSYVSFRGGDFSFDKQPNTFGKKTYPFEPNFEVNAVVPVSRNFGFTASGLISRAPANGQGSLMTWAPTTNPDVFNLTAFRLQERPKITVRESLSLGADWRVSRTDVLTLGFQYAYFTTKFWVRQLNFSTGTVASSGADFTQGANGTGAVQILYDAREKAGTTVLPTFKYKHNGPVWEWQVNGAFGRSSNYYRNLDKGYFNMNNAFLRNVTVRFEKMNFDHPDVVTVRNSTNTADVNPYQLSNYNLESVSATRQDGYDIVRSMSLFAKRDLGLRLPFVIKAGADLKSQHRDIGNQTFAGTYVGKDGIAANADNNASVFLDPVYSQHSLLFGPPMQWMNLHTIVDTYKANPSYISQTEANLVTGYRDNVTNSKVIDETTVAPYVRFDTKFFNGRVDLTGGVRYERVTDQGAGPLIDLTRTYQRDAAGNIVRNAAGQPVSLVNVATLAGTKLAYIERGAKTDSTDARFFPSLSTTVRIIPNLLARVAYGRSISRPEFTDLFASANLPDPSGTSRTISLSNPLLKPWVADSYSAALEYYFNEPASGVLSVRGYRRDIKDFWGTTLSPATDELLAIYGLDPATYGAAQGYMISTKQNLNDTRIYGAEVDYRQNLTFLPHWARGFTIFGNLTMQHLKGNETASFSGLFVAKTANFGLTFSRQRLTMRIAVNQKGTVRQGAVTGANREPGTYQYIAPRNSADFSAEYRLTRKFALFVGGRNINEATDDTVIYGPNTRSDRILSARADYRAYWNIGLKGTF